jgi:lipooligosaccharide transport system permease protein
VRGLAAGAAGPRARPDAGWLRAAVAWQSRAVVLRHLRVHLHNWHTAFLPPVGEPVTMLLAFGLGLGGYVGVLDWRGRPVDYPTYVAPGLLAYAAFMTSVFQALFAAFIRMRYQRTWEGQLTTQVELRHVVWGEVLWAALLATIYVLVVALVLVAFTAAGLLRLDLAWLPATLPIAFLAACAFAAFGLCFTALVPTIDHMNLPVFLVVIPMGLLSGTYFPITHPALRRLSAVNPLYHLAQCYRGLLLGGPVAGHLAALLGLSAVMVAGLVPLDLRLLRRRILGD